LAKIAVAVSHALTERVLSGALGRTSGRVLACGEGWTVRDVVCTCGPQDRSFEEQHSQVSIAVVAAGTFQYRSAVRGRVNRELMTPGSLLLGSAGQYFECGHEHAAGDRCISFQYVPEYFESIAAAIVNAHSGFHMLRIPPLRSLSPVVARACAALDAAEEVTDGRVSDPQSAQLIWEELAVKLVASAIQLAAGYPLHSSTAPPNALASVTRIVRKIEVRPDSRLTLGSLARESRLSLYHFLRTFESLTGVTPHQYILRARLRAAASRLASEPGRVLDIALDCGFGDVSNFNRAFRTEFGICPREYRRNVNRDGTRS
jgi:AraC family transcriptional regulator